MHTASYLTKSIVWVSSAIFYFISITVLRNIKCLDFWFWQYELQNETEFMDIPLSILWGGLARKPLDSPKGVRSKFRLQCSFISYGYKLTDRLGRRQYFILSSLLLMKQQHKWSESSTDFESRPRSDNVWFTVKKKTFVSLCVTFSLFLSVLTSVLRSSEKRKMKVKTIRSVRLSGVCVGVSSRVRLFTNGSELRQMPRHGLALRLRMVSRLALVFHSAHLYRCSVLDQPLSALSWSRCHAGLTACKVLVYLDVWPLFVAHHRRRHCHHHNYSHNRDYLPSVPSDLLKS